MSENPEPLKKVTLLIIGNSSVGKSSYLKVFKGKDFTEKYLSTIGYDSVYKNMKFNKINKEIKVEIFDTAGQERYRACVRTLFRKAQGIMLMYDVTEKESFEDLSKWIEEIKQNAKEGTPVVVLGNKVDLIDDRIVQEEEGRKFAGQYNYGFFETSVKENIQINEPVIWVAEKVIDMLGGDLGVEAGAVLNKEEHQGKKKKKKCC